MKKLALLFALLFGWPVYGHSQNLNRAKLVIDSLCAPYMHGRGYTNNGDKIAANFIEKEFKAIGLRALGTGFQQPFQLTVNTFAKQPSVLLDSKKLAVGTDFIVGSNSGAAEGGGILLELDTAYFTNRSVQNKWLASPLSDKVLLITEKFDRQLMALPPTLLKKLLQAKAIVTASSKLTHSVAAYQLPIPRFYVKSQIGLKNGGTFRFKVEPELKEGYTSQNVIGYFEGTEQPDKYLVFTAHYDHLGDMGEVYFAGANDNASGVAMLLEIAHHYAANPPAYTVVFMAFGAEEAGLLGSKFYTENPLFPLGKIEFLLNLDLFATGEEGTTVVNATVFEESFSEIREINNRKNYLAEVKSRGKAANSDHYYFSEKGVPSFFLYLMGDWKHYHDINDRPPVPLSDFADSFQLLVDFTDRQMK